MLVCQGLWKYNRLWKVSGPVAIPLALMLKCFANMSGSGKRRKTTFIYRCEPDRFPIAAFGSWTPLIACQPAGSPSRTTASWLCSLSKIAAVQKDRKPLMAGRLNDDRLYQTACGKWYTGHLGICANERLTSSGHIPNQKGSDIFKRSSDHCR